MRRTYVRPSGNTLAKLALVGEQPGYHEIASGKPFVGPAGKALDECLSMTRIPRQQLYILSLIHI